MASPVTVSVVIPADIHRVWAELADLPAHVKWMADAHRLTFLGNQRSGVGTRIEVETRFGPMHTADIMEFTTWDPPNRMAVRHEGLFNGFGEFRLTDIGGRTLLEWKEQIEFPRHFGGRLGAWVARPLFALVWRRNLRRLRERFTSP